MEPKASRLISPVGGLRAVNVHSRWPTSPKTGRSFGERATSFQLFVQLFTEGPLSELTGGGIVGRFMDSAATVEFNWRKPNYKTQSGNKATERGCLC